MLAASRRLALGNLGHLGVRHNSNLLKERLQQIMPAKVKEVADIRKNHADIKIGDVTIGAAYGGARGIKCLVTETSLLDPEEGIRFRGYTIPECQEKLPKAKGGAEPLPEGLLWLLMTGELPTKEQVAWLSKDLHARSAVPDHVLKLIKTFPKTMHPMTQFVSAVAAAQTESVFAKGYASGVGKDKYWELTLEDSLNLIAKLPVIASEIYLHTYKNGAKGTGLPAGQYDWGADMAVRMGFKDPKFLELARLYLTIHSDHEGGNVSAHTTHLVGSALSDPYLSFAGGMAGLAGPLHGLANQEVLRWIKELQKNIGSDSPTTEQIEKYCWDTLNAKKVIPGYGHAVLRKTDPRYTCQREFAMKHLPNDKLFKIVSALYEVVPKVLTKQGKTANPWPNVDAHSGVLLVHYGLTEENFYTVMFGVSRALGVLSSLVWDRALGLPIERPKSITTEWVKNFIDASKKGTAVITNDD